MANLVLAFGEILAGAIILDAGVKGDTIANVVQGKATQHPLPGSSTSSTGTTAGISSGTSSTSTGGYVNPLPSANPSRIDEGGDYVLPAGGKFLAPGPSKIVAVDQRSGFGNYIAAVFTSGPLAGVPYYVAEGVSSLVKVGDTVNAGQPIAQAGPSQYGTGVIEAGWANTSNYDPLAQSLSGFSGDQSTASLTAGYSWSKFVSALGGPLATFQGAGAQLKSDIENLFAQGVPAGVPYG